MSDAELKNRIDALVGLALWLGAGVSMAVYMVFQGDAPAWLRVGGVVLSIIAVWAFVMARRSFNEWLGDFRLLFRRYRVEARQYQEIRAREAFRGD